MNGKSIALVVAGMVAGTAFGIAIGPTLTRVSAHVAPSLSAAAKVAYKGRETRLKTPRLQPVTAKDFTPEQKAVALAVATADGTNDNFRTALHNPELARQWWIW